MMKTYLFCQFCNYYAYCLYYKEESEIKDSYIEDGETHYCDTIFIWEFSSSLPGIEI